jgi:hypothetical protein
MTTNTKVILALLCLVGVSGGHCLAAGEASKPAKPTGATPQQPAIDAATEEKYQALVATLPPDEQAWERTLQANLGSFYLPIHERERVKGIPNAWACTTRRLSIGERCILGCSSCPPGQEADRGEHISGGRNAPTSSWGSVPVLLRAVRFGWSSTCVRG